ERRRNGHVPTHRARGVHRPVRAGDLTQAMIQRKDAKTQRVILRTIAAWTGFHEQREGRTRSFFIFAVLGALRVFAFKRRWAVLRRCASAASPICAGQSPSRLCALGGLCAFALKAGVKDWR